MFCDHCGKELAEGARFCASCGKTVTGAVPVAGHGRVARHLQIVAILWLGASVLRLCAGLALLVVGSVFLPAFLSGWPFNRLVPGIISTVAIGFLVVAAAGFAAGWGLLQRESWGRGLVLVLAVLALLNFPLGTALGIYTLWVLLPQPSAEEYGRMAMRQ